MSLAYDILERFLYKEDVQQLARDRGLPTNRPKDELVALLLRSGRFVPAEALRYLNKRELRQICQEYLLPDDGDREVLFRRVLAAIFAGERSAPPEGEPNVGDEEDPEEDDEEENEPGDPDAGEEQEPDDEDEPEPAPGRPSLRLPTGEAREPGSAGGFLRIPPAEWPTPIPAVAYAPARDISREHPDSTAPWAVASIVAGAILSRRVLLLHFCVRPRGRTGGRYHSGGRRGRSSATHTAPLGSMARILRAILVRWNCKEGAVGARIGLPGLSGQ